MQIRVSNTAVLHKGSLEQIAKYRMLRCYHFHKANFKVFRGFNLEKRTHFSHKHIMLMWQCVHSESSSFCWANFMYTPPLYCSLWLHSNGINFLHPVLWEVAVIDGESLKKRGIHGCAMHTHERTV